MPLHLALVTFTRYADGSLHIEGQDPVLSENEAAQLDNYLVATATALASTRTRIAADVIEVQEQAAIDAAQKITEVLP